MNRPDSSSLAAPIGAPGTWSLDPEIVFLNHGSFGACPRAVLDFQRALQDRMERQPLQFLWRDIEELQDKARSALANFLVAEADNLVLVPNATGGVNSVLRSLSFKAGDELLVTDQEYNACRNVLNFVAERDGAKIVVAEVPFPLESADQIVDAILGRATSRTRLALFDHVTSQTALVMPAARIVAELNARGIESLIDGAHAPGMVPIDLKALGATYYTGNCHKWLCAPKASGFLYVQPDRQHLIRPISISHGANSRRTDRSRFQIEFGWTGTSDPSPVLSVPETMRFMGSLLPGGWPAIMARNRELALAGRQVLCQALNIDPPCPAECIGSIATVPLRDTPHPERLVGPLFQDPLQDALLERFRIEIPIIHWPRLPKRLIRISAQLYNSLPQYEFLAEALGKLLPRSQRPPAKPEAYQSESGSKPN